MVKTIRKGKKQMINLSNYNFDETENDNLYIMRNKHKKIIFISPIFFNKTKFNMKNIHLFYEALHDEDHVGLNVEHILSTMEDTTTLELHYSAGMLIPVECNYLSFSINKNKYYLEHYRLKQDLDPLTNLPTRVTLKLNFDELVYNKQLPLLVFMDFDNFAKLNTTLGYVKTDYILQHISSIMKSHFKPHGVYRYGGDEFIVLADKSVDIKDLMKSFREKIRNISFLKDFDYSYGVVSYPNEGTTLDELVNKASEIMKQHKKTKKL